MRLLKITFLMVINILLFLMMLIPMLVGYLLAPVIAGLMVGYSVASNHIEMIQLTVEKLRKGEQNEE